MAGINLEKELAFYRKHHRNKTNVLIHIVCVPMILFSSLLLGANHHYGDNIYLNPAMLTAVGYGIYYTLLDVKFGLPTVPVLLYSVFKFSQIVNSESKAAANKFAIGLFLFSWIAQFSGHKWFERKAPSLFESLIQALVLAPFFVLFEIAYFLGCRRDIMDGVDNYIKEHKLK